MVHKGAAAAGTQAKKRKFKGLRGLIAEVEDFRGGLGNKNYLDVKLAIALRTLLDRQDALEKTEDVVVVFHGGNLGHGEAYGPYDTIDIAKETWLGAAGATYYKRTRYQDVLEEINA